MPHWCPLVTYLLGLPGSVPRSAGCLLGTCGCQTVVGTFHLQGIGLPVQEPNLLHGTHQLLLCTSCLGLHLRIGGIGVWCHRTDCMVGMGSHSHKGRGSYHAKGSLAVLDVTGSLLQCLLGHALGSLRLLQCLPHCLSYAPHSLCP